MIKINMLSCLEEREKIKDYVKKETFIEKFKFISRLVTVAISGAISACTILSMLFHPVTYGKHWQVLLLYAVVTGGFIWLAFFCRQKYRERIEKIKEEWGLFYLS